MSILLSALAGFDEAYQSSPITEEDLLFQGLSKRNHELFGGTSILTSSQSIASTSIVLESAKPLEVFDDSPSKVLESPKPLKVSGEKDAVVILAVEYRQKKNIVGAKDPIPSHSSGRTTRYHNKRPVSDSQKVQKQQPSKQLRAS